MNDAIAIGDVLTVIDDGKIIESGDIASILKSDHKFIKEFFYEIYQDNMFMNGNRKNGAV